MWEVLVICPTLEVSCGVLHLSVRLTHIDRLLESLFKPLITIYEVIKALERDGKLQYIYSQLSEIFISIIVYLIVFLY